MSGARHIFFSYNRDKATQAVLWLLNRHGRKIKKLTLVKLIFLADEEHLFRYGRPIAGGEYYAMRWGPVCSSLLSDLDESSQKPDSPYYLEGHDVVANAPADEEYLSESDLSVLKEIDLKFGSLGRFKVSGYTHKLPSYKHAWGDRTEGRAALSYEDFFLDTQDCAMLDIIRDDQEAWACLE